MTKTPGALAAPGRGQSWWIGLVVVTLALGCKSESKPSGDKSAEPAGKVVKEAPAKADPAAWTAEQSAELVAKCNKAWLSVDEAGIRACYDDAFASKSADDVFGFPEEMGSDSHVKGAKEFRALFDHDMQVQLTIATPTRVAEIWFQEQTATDEFPIPGARGKKLVLLTGKLSRLDGKGKLVSELHIPNQAAFGNQTGLWKSPFPSAEVKKWPEPIAVASSNSATEKTNLDVVRRADAAFHARDVDAYVSFYADKNKAWEPMGIAEFSSRAEMKKQLEGHLESRFKESSETALDEFAAGDWVVRLIRQKVRLHDKLEKFPEAGGKSAETTNLQISRLKDGLIVESYGFYNPLSIQTQIGLFDPAAAQKLIADALAEMKQKEKSSK